MYNNPSVNGNTYTPRNRKERKVSVAFRHCGEHQHCAGVESLALSPSGNTLYTASRDSTVKRWNLSSATPTFEVSFEGHADWVNDVSILNDHLVTCSADKTVKLWKAASGQCVHTWYHHSDYVTAVAASKARNMAASAGLRSEVFLLDFGTGNCTQVFPKQKLVTTEESDVTNQAQWSVYSLAMNAAGTLIAAGTTESSIRLIDPRAGRKTSKLRGHTDNVRCVLVNEEGTLVLSGSSDGTIKLWDVGQQRCLQTSNVHHDSVWTLATQDWSTVYSGGKDRTIFRTHLFQRTSELLAVEHQPVRKLVMDFNLNTMYVATPSSTVHKWDLPQECVPTATAGSLEKRSYVNSSTSLRLRSMSEARNTDPAMRTPAARIYGAAGIIQHRVLNDRRHVLTRDSDGNVALWDVLAGSMAQQFGRTDLEKKEKELFEPVSMPAWFSSDNRLGMLSITLDPPACFSAEIYATELDYTNVADDYKINYGKLVLEGVFAKWRTKVGQNAQGDKQGDGTPTGQQNRYYTEPWPKYWEKDKLPPLVMCQDAQLFMWRTTITQFTGREQEPDEVPAWVGDVVLRNLNVTPKEGKCAFILSPAENSNLPALSQSKLNAPKILQVHKVASYCLSKLQEQNIVLESRPVYYTQPVNAPTLPVTNDPSKLVLELVCNGVAAPYELSLASVKKYIWKKSDDLLFHYRIRDPAHPAALPKFD